MSSNAYVADSKPHSLDIVSRGRGRTKQLQQLNAT